jgi:DNA-damage-inducible protein J
MKTLKPEVKIMLKTDTLHIRIEPDLKAKVESTLNQLGMSTSEAVNIFLRQVILTGGLPFEVKLPQPNATTLKPLKKAKIVSKTGKSYTNVELMKELNN